MIFFSLPGIYNVPQLFCHHAGLEVLKSLVWLVYINSVCLQGCLKLGPSTTFTYTQHTHIHAHYIHTHTHTSPMSHQLDFVPMPNICMHFIAKSVFSLVALYFSAFAYIYRVAMISSKWKMWWPTGARAGHWRIFRIKSSLLKVVCHEKRKCRARKTEVGETSGQALAHKACLPGPWGTSLRLNPADLLKAED